MTMRLTPSTLPAVQEALAAAGLDGWLLYDFRGVNPIAFSLLGLEGMLSRRVFALIPREGPPVAVTHAIEQGPWTDWPPEWKKVVYSGWRSLESEVAALVSGRKVAMEYAAGDAIPYLDRIPAGVLELVRSSGADVVSSGDLVTRFFAGWSQAGFDSHVETAEAIATIADEVLRECGRRARTEDPATEFEAVEWIRKAFAERRLTTDHGPNVSVGANAANPHYEPTAESSAVITTNQVLLIDLWAFAEGGVWADQTWMAWIGDEADPAMIVGTPYECVYQPMPLALQMQNGTSRSRELRIHRIVPDLEASYGGKFGPALDRLLSLHEDSLPHTGEIEKGFAGSHDLTGDLVITADAPAPFILRGLTVKFNAHGDQG